jgi:hypothetical protein
MASSFTGAANSNIRCASTPVTAAPLTMACWFYSTNNANAQVMMSICESVDSDRFQLAALGNAAGKNISCYVEEGGANDNTCQTLTGYTVNKWHHAAAVYSSSTSRSVFIDGGSKDTGNNTSYVPQGINEILIGARRLNGSIGAAFFGLIAEVGIWNVALTDDEVLSLSKGFAPYLVRPQNLRFYNRLIRNGEVDIVGNRTLILSNVSTGDHPRIYG